MENVGAVSASHHARRYRQRRLHEASARCNNEYDVHRCPPLQTQMKEEKRGWLQLDAIEHQHRVMATISDEDETPDRVDGDVK